jgi:hypothetical protein
MFDEKPMTFDQALHSNYESPNCAIHHVYRQWKSGQIIPDDRLRESLLHYEAWMKSREPHESNER